MNFVIGSEQSRAEQSRAEQSRAEQSRAEQSDTLCLFAPAYNEAENIKNFVEEWYPIVEKYNSGGRSRLVIIDDGSTDNTFQILKDLKSQERYQEFLVPITKKNGGHGSAVLAGYRYALENQADYIFQTDSDGQTLPSEFENFWNLRNDYGAVLGKRLNRKDGVGRKFVENVLRLVVKIIFGVSLPDANAPFRLMRRSLIEKYINKIPEDFNLPNVIFTVCFAYFHENIKFVDITFRPRQGGVNSINFKKIFKIGVKALSDFRKIANNLKAQSRV